MDDFATPPPTVEIQMVSDLACPWCYIGWRRLDRAEALRPGVEIKRRWWPFLLNPHLPEDGMDREAYAEAKFGGKGAAKRVYQRIAEAGAEDGIEFAFHKIKRTPNTINAQRLILLASAVGQDRALAERLFVALFVGGEDVGRIEVLLDHAEAVGMERAKTERFLRADDLRDEVTGAHLLAERQGVRGVPVFVAERRHAISGAQAPEVLAGLIDLALTPETAPP